MNKLLKGMQQQPTTITKNGDPAHATTWNANLDLFGRVGALRTDQDAVIRLFRNAMAEDQDLAVRIALWARDIRGGAGERESFRSILRYLAEKCPDVAKRVLPLVSEVGRWDDLLEVLNVPSLKDDVVHLIGSALYEGDALCAKWMPRKGLVAVSLRQAFGLTPKQYRKLLVALTNVVESKMCAKQWSEIEFGKLPALASARYQKAFERNAPTEYNAYAQALVKGEAKINAGAIFPHDVLQAAFNGRDDVASAQWAALPDYMEGTDERVLAMVDVSGSMDCPINGSGRVGDSSVTCMQVAVALGIYCAERNNGPFKNHFITFTDVPRLQQVSGGTLATKARTVMRNVGYDTNIDRAFDLILQTAIRNKVPESDMPSMILVLSDMQFNRGYGYNKTAHQRFTEAYAAAGYKMPKLVYWNLNAQPGNSPITMHDSGAALVSGFSPAILRSVLRAEKFDPCSVMLDTVMIDRYKWQTV